MTRIKLCGLTRSCDIVHANRLLPDYVGFVFAKESRRYISPEKAELLRVKLKEEIVPVGVFVNESPEFVADLANRNTIGIIQLHGSEDESYLRELRRSTDRPVIQAFRIQTEADVERANRSTADSVLLDSGGGTGDLFDHNLIKGIRRPYFLAGGLTSDNVHDAIKMLHPYAVDASSSLETDGLKDQEKMTAFVNAVRRGCDYE